MAKVYDYETGEHIGWVQSDVYDRYLSEIECLTQSQRDTGAVDGDNYGFPGIVIYMDE